MNQDDQGTVWFVIGVGVAVGLGVALVPFRTIVSASNLAFVFIALTIVVAEMGGRGAGLATAVVSALSLNFFLTEPYLSRDRQARRHRHLHRACGLRPHCRGLREAARADRRAGQPDTG